MGAIGFTPQELNEMSLWQSMQVIEGVRKANDPNAGKELSQAEVDDVWEWMQSKETPNR